jgi:hypothetical protein
MEDNAILKVIQAVKELFDIPENDIEFNRLAAQSTLNYLFTRAAMSEQIMDATQLLKELIPQLTANFNFTSRNPTTGLIHTILPNQCSSLNQPAIEDSEPLWFWTELDVVA